MELIDGARYNLRGLGMGVKNGKLLFWGIVRFLAVMIITIISAGLILAYHQDIMSLIWTKPQSNWILWLWYFLSWLLSFLLIVVSAVLSYLISQILFGVLIMDLMSRITEKIITGQVKEPGKMRLLSQFSYLMKQEIPRTLIPVFISLLVMIMGWVIPLGSILVLLSSGVAALFLAWDNTDLVPARRMMPFGERFGLLRKRLPFHIGFGLLFLIPGLNILLLSFAPVGATLYYLDKEEQTTDPKAKNGTP
jgi:CysZ protein